MEAIYYHYKTDTNSPSIVFNTKTIKFYGLTKNK